MLNCIKAKNQTRDKLILFLLCKKHTLFASAALFIGNLLKEDLLNLSDVAK